MTSVEILFHTAAPHASSEAAASALAKLRDVYGIRRLSFDAAASALRVEYDATRLNAAAVAKLLRQAGLVIAPQENP